MRGGYRCIRKSERISAATSTRTGGRSGVVDKTSRTLLTPWMADRASSSQRTGTSSLDVLFTNQSARRHARTPSSFLVLFLFLVLSQWHRGCVEIFWYSGYARHRSHNPTPSGGGIHRNCHAVSDSELVEPDLLSAPCAVAWHKSAPGPQVVTGATSTPTLLARHSSHLNHKHPSERASCQLEQRTAMETATVTEMEWGSSSKWGECMVSLSEMPTGPTTRRRDDSTSGRRDDAMRCQRP